MISGPKTKFRQLEKLAYLLGIPVIAGLGAFTVYKKNVMEAEARAKKLKLVEEKFVGANPENMIKLQNFNKRVFAIGTVDDIGIQDRDSVDHRKAISKNAAMIRDFCKKNPA